jgi:hypothetical protein
VSAGLRYDFKAADYGITNERVGAEIGKRLAGEKSFDLGDGFQNIAKAFPSRACRQWNIWMASASMLAR